MPSKHLPAAGSQRAHQRLQARVWEPDAAVLLARIGVARGWSCADLGCGAEGILPLLSRRVGPRGRVVGVERDPALAAAAREMAAAEGLANVEIVEADLHRSGLPPAGFDLVHVRFVLHVPRPLEILRSMTALARAGGWLAAQEPDLTSWRCLPECPAWPRLLALLRGAIALDSDPDVGSRVEGMLRDLGIEDANVRRARLVLGGGHPSMRLPLAWAAAQRERILGNRLANEDELDELVAGVERHVGRPGVLVVSATTVQVWGRRA